MKNKTLKIMLFTIMATSISLSCSKDRLPGLTQEGKNTFGCKINGKNWVPHGGGGFSGIEPVNGGYQATYSFNTTSNNVFILAYNGKTNINIYLRSVEKAGVYPLEFNTLDVTNQRNPFNYGYFQAEDGSEYLTNRECTGKVNVIKADTLNNIISGTFYFTAINKNTGEKVKITDGRFDIKAH